MRKFADIVNDANIDITFRSQTPHYYFGKHIRYYFYFHVVATSAVNICGIVMGVIAFIYPHLHRESPVFTQILQHYERIHNHFYYFWYNFIVFFFIINFTVQIITSIVGIVGTKLRNPYLLIPHMILILFHVGLIIVLFVCFAVINFLLDKWVFVLPVIVGTFAISAAIDLFITVACYRFVAERQLLMKAYTANTKQVHFKKKRRQRHR